MPRIQRSNLPRALFAHLLDRIKTRNISADQLPSRKFPKENGSRNFPV